MVLSDQDVFNPVPAQNPYPGARTQVTPKFVHSKQMASWGKTGVLIQGGGYLVDGGAQFITAGLVATDTFYLCASSSGETFATTVLSVDSETEIIINHVLHVAATAVHYKAGVRNIHTLATLMKHMQAVGDNSHMVRWGRIWSNAQPVQFNNDHTGYLYVIN